MRKNWVAALVFVVIMIFVMRWQGQQLVTPASPRGILDLEFARTAERLKQLKLFWNPAHLMKNIYLDFLFIFSYTWFLSAAAMNLSERTGWERTGKMVVSLAIAAGFFDILENFLMIMIYQGRFQPGLLELVYIVALVKFLMAALALVYIIISLPFVFLKTKRIKEL
jgi:hypothetical protein